MTEQTATPPTADELLARIDLAWVAWEAAIDQAGNAALGDPGPDGWSGKDHLAHVEAWERYLLALLERRSPATAVGLDPATYRSLGEDGLNERFRQEAQPKSLDTVKSEMRHTRHRLRTAVAGWPATELSRPAAEILPEELGDETDTVAGWIVDFCDDHLREHIDLVRRLSG